MCVVSVFLARRCHRLANMYEPVFFSSVVVRKRLNKSSMVMSNSNQDCHLYFIWCCSFIVEHNKRARQLYCCKTVSHFRKYTALDWMNCLEMLDHLWNRRAVPLHHLKFLDRTDTYTLFCTLSLSLFRYGKNSCFCLIFITWFMVYLFVFLVFLRLDRA